MIEAAVIAVSSAILGAFLHSATPVEFTSPEADPVAVNFMDQPTNAACFHGLRLYEDEFVQGTHCFDGYPDHDGDGEAEMMDAMHPAL